jgi:cytochrome c-type biogenesis protein
VNIEALAAQLTNGSSLGLAAAGIAFLGGMVAGFGPCVLPMMPAVFGYVTGRVAEVGDDAPPRVALARGLGLSAVFVLGMSLVFASIGALAGLLGHAIIAGPWAYYLVAAVCVVIGLQMLGVLNLPVDRLNRFLPSRKPGRGGFFGTLSFGMLFGLVASPCSTPILAAIATMAAASGSAASGAVLLFIFGLGKGVPLIVLGLASGSLTFMRVISRATPVLTKIGGAALLGAAGYLVWLA